MLICLLAGCAASITIYAQFHTFSVSFFCVPCVTNQSSREQLKLGMRSYGRSFQFMLLCWQQPEPSWRASLDSAPFTVITVHLMFYVRQYSNACMCIHARLCQLSIPLLPGISYLFITWSVVTAPIFSSMLRLPAFRLACSTHALYFRRQVVFS